MARKLNYVLLVSLINLFVVSIAGCGLSDMGSHAGDVRLAWSEEVRLPGGDLVVVDRTAIGQKDGEIGGPGGWKSSGMTLSVPAAAPNRVPPPAWRGGSCASPAGLRRPAGPMDADSHCLVLPGLVCVGEAARTLSGIPDSERFHVGIGTTGSWIFRAGKQSAYRSASHR